MQELLLLIFLLDNCSEIEDSFEDCLDKSWPLFNSEKLLLTYENSETLQKLSALCWSSPLVSTPRVFSVSHDVEREGDNETLSNTPFLSISVKYHTFII